MKRTEETIEREIINKYLSGLSCKEVGTIFNVSETTVFNILNRYNINTRTKGGIYQLNHQLIDNLYNRGYHVNDIALLLNVHEKTIYNYMEQNNIERNFIYHNQLLDHNYFKNIDLFHKAYFLGFMISDGCVLDNNNISLTLKSSDDDILKIFSLYIQNFNPIYYSPRNEATFHCKSPILKDDLSKYGVIPRKTSITYLPQLREDLMPHLIRGLIDGDGWISEKSHQIGFCGNHNIVTQVRDYLSFKLNIYPVKVLDIYENLSQITWASRKDITIIGNYIYNNPYNCLLIRKFNNFMKIPR